MKFPNLPDNPDLRVLSEFGHDAEAPAQRQIRRAKAATQIAPAQATATVEADYIASMDITPPKGRIVRLTLPEAPSGNRYWRTARRGKNAGTVYRSEVATAYIKQVQTLAAAVGATPFPKGTEVAMIGIWYRSRLQGDTGNRFKVLDDALQGFAYEDDEQIAEELHLRRLDRKNPRMEVIVWAL